MAFRRAAVVTDRDTALRVVLVKPDVGGSRDIEPVPVVRRIEDVGSDGEPSGIHAVIVILMK